MKNILLTFALAAAMVGTGCARRADVEKVPVGTKVEVTRQDGGVLRGTLTARDDKTVNLQVGSASRTVARDQIAEVQVLDGTPAALPALAKFREYTLPQGTKLAARLSSPVGSDSSRVGDPIEATLTEAIVVDSTEVLPAGTVVSGEVEAVRSSGGGKTRASVSLVFRSAAIAGSDERYPIAARVGLVAAEKKSNDVAKIAIPAAGGAILGGLLGGGKGAVIGGVIGAGAGTAVVLTTHGPEIRLARGTLLSLPLEQAVDVRVPINKS